MTRVKSSVARRQRHKSIIKKCKGYFGRAKSCFKIAKRLYIRAQNFKFEGRKNNKRQNRSQSICIINAFCKSNNTKYSKFIHQLNNHPIRNIVDRKSLAISIQNNITEAKKIFNIVTQANSSNNN